MKTYIIEFTEKHLTKNAGLYLIGTFADKLNLTEELKRNLTIRRAPNAKYCISDIILMLIMSVIAGAKHVNQFAILRFDYVIRDYFTWQKFPDDRTFGRLFNLFNYEHCAELLHVESIIRNKIWSIKWFGRITLDMDSTVKGVYGSQQGAEKGYNHKKRGQKSYHPLLCFIAENRECFHNWFRCGSSYTSNGVVEFTKECFAKLPPNVWKIFVRADSGFFNGNFLDLLESKGCEYLIKVKLKKLKQLLMRQSWRKSVHYKGIETSLFIHKCSTWNKSRTFMAIRKIVKEADQYMLFPEPEYEFFCYVTNCNITPMKAHKRYGERATSENWIEWCKNHMASGTILTQEFWANSAMFQSCIFGYNLLVWMMWLSENRFKEEPNTIRFWLINIPGRLTHSGRRWKLKLPKEYVFKERFEKIRKSIKALNIDT